MRPLPAILCAAVMVVCSVPSVCAGETATATVTVSVQIASRTSLRVSSDVLHFDAPGTNMPASADVEFSAGARVPHGADVVLTVEPEGAIASGGAADVETAVTFEGEGEGTVNGTLAAMPSVASRWQGSGLRKGRIRFTLHTTAAGTYAVPVRFVLTTP